MEPNNHLHRSLVCKGRATGSSLASSVNIGKTSKCGSCIAAIKLMQLADSLVSRFLFPIFEHWSKVKPRALAPCLHWLHAFSLLALSTEACKVRPFVYLPFAEKHDRNAKAIAEALLLHGAADPFSIPPRGLTVNGYEQLKTKTKTKKPRDFELMLT